MTLATPIRAGDAAILPGLTQVATLADLARLRDPDCAAALWPRALPPEVARWLDALDPAQMPRGRVVLRPGAVAETVAHLGDIAGLPNGVERRWLEADITRLAAAFTTLMSAPYLRLRLDIITGNACRRFHVDAITARLICTYRGTATQLGHAKAGRAPDAIVTVPTGSPLLMRGTLWPPETGGLLHRSPPIEGTGEARLVLVLDPIFDPEDEV